MMRKATRIALISLRRKKNDPKLLLTLALMVAFLWTVASPLADFTSLVGYAICPFVAPFILSSETNQLIAAIGLMFLLSDAPFVNESQLFIIQRTGRKTWVLGNVLYVLILTAGYTVTIVLLSSLLLMPVSTLNLEGWGKVISTLAYTDAAAQFHITIPFAAKIVYSFSPLQALFLQLVLEYLALSFIGLSLFFVNLITRSKIGLLFGGFVCIFDLMIVNTLPVQYLAISPMSMARLTMLDFSTNSYIYPSIDWAIGFNLSLVAVFAVLSILFSRYVDIDESKV